MEEKFEEEKFLVQLCFEPQATTESVAVVGDFTGWEDKIYLEKTEDGNIWKTSMELPSGEYAYHFLIDGNNFRLDPCNPLQIDRKGTFYSKLVVGDTAREVCGAEHTDKDIDVYSANTIYMKIRLNKNIFISSKLILVINDIPQSITGYKLFDDLTYSHFMFKFQTGIRNNGIIYYFELEKTTAEIVYFGQNGIVGLEWEVEDFEYNHSCLPLDPNLLWLESSVLYQDGCPDPEKIGYIKDLNISAVYFNGVSGLKHSQACLLNKTLSENSLKLISEEEYNTLEKNSMFMDACIEFFAKKNITAENFASELGRQLEANPMQGNFSMLLKLSEEGASCFYSLAGGDFNSLKLAAAFQFTYIGVPFIYSGEENGMENNSNILALYKSLIRIRRENSVISEGDIKFFYARNGIIGFDRFTPSDRLTVFINNSGKNFQIDLTEILGNGDFIDISKDHTLKRKKVFTLYENDFVVLRKMKDR
jgi:hypothetical protein